MGLKWGETGARNLSETLNTDKGALRQVDITMVPAPGGSVGVGSIACTATSACIVQMKTVGAGALSAGYLVTLNAGAGTVTLAGYDLAGTANTTDASVQTVTLIG